MQDTLLRLSGFVGVQAPLSVCNEDHRFMMAEQLWEINAKPAAIILEPVGKNTAPAITIAALSADKDDIVRFSDHYGRI